MRIENNLQNVSMPTALFDPLESIVLIIEYFYYYYPL